MAVTCFSSLQIPLQKSCPATNPRNKVIMLKHTQIPVKKSPLLQVRSFKNKVFENQSEGIVCYKDDNGEIICEGFDEGPRFHNHPPIPAYNSRDAEIISLLHQRLVEFKKSAVQEDFKWNEFNKFC